MLLALHQPNYLPYLGNFHKMAQVDLFVFFDNVPLGQGKSWVSRNRINLDGREMWLTVPTVKSGRSGQLIKDVETRWDTPWPRKHLGTIRQAYRKSPYLEEVAELLRREFDRQPRSISELNIAIIKALAGMLGIQCRFAVASERVNTESRGTDMIREVCQAFGCTDYLTGTGYPELRPEEIEEKGIRVHFQQFHHPVYDSLGGQFIPDMSILDAILSAGPDKVGRWLSAPQRSTVLSETRSER